MHRKMNKWIEAYLHIPNTAAAAFVLLPIPSYEVIGRDK